LGKCGGVMALRVVFAMYGCFAESLYCTSLKGRETIALISFIIHIKYIGVYSMASLPLSRAAMSKTRQHNQSPNMPPGSLAKELNLSGAPQILGRVMRYALHYRWRFAVAGSCSLAATLFSLAIPRLLGWSVDQAHAMLQHAGGTPQGAIVSRLAYIGFFLVAAAAARGFAQMVAGYQSQYIAQAVGRDLRLQFFEKLQRLGFAFHDHIHSGDLITRGMLDLEGVRGFIENALQACLSLLLLVVIGAIMLVLQNPLMALLAMSFVPFAAWRAGRMGLVLRLAWTKLQEKMSVLTRVMEENLQGMRVVRAFAAKLFEISKFDEAGDEALRLSNRRIFIRSGSMVFINSSYFLAMGLVVWVGGREVQAHRFTVGELTEFLTLMTILQQPVRQMGMIMNASARAVSSGKRLFEILDMVPNIRDREDAKELQVQGGVLEFEDISFSFDGAANVLEHISFTVQPGRTLGIVGPSGAGKSTIAQLIPRFYDVSAGRITIDGQDIREVTLDSLRNAVGLIQQDVFLFDDGIDSNIAYADPEAEIHELIDAARTAQIHDFAASLPAAYATRIGERGMGLSGGQRQRLSIARGMVPDPAVVVFDDATSAVDAATEHQLRHALRAATGEQSTIIISHRLGSLLHADEIIVLDAGRIIERGTHERLIAAGGYYAALFRAQSQSAAEGTAA
jgi:ATP-binding cassette subfamily B multidrug efflux pump